MPSWSNGLTPVRLEAAKELEVRTDPRGTREAKEVKAQMEQLARGNMLLLPQTRVLGLEREYAGRSVTRGVAPENMMEAALMTTVKSGCLKHEKKRGRERSSIDRNKPRMAVARAATEGLEVTRAKEKEKISPEKAIQPVKARARKVKEKGKSLATRRVPKEKAKEKVKKDQRAELEEARAAAQEPT